MSVPVMWYNCKHCARYLRLAQCLYQGGKDILCCTQRYMEKDTSILKFRYMIQGIIC